jgi:penicillin amidase
MRRMWRALKLLLLLVVALAVAVGLHARHAARRALPELDGELAAAGLAGRVEVLRDRWGVPHIFAASDDDAYYALGYVHAQDRLFQLDLNRHAGQGRLSELFGERALRADKLFRTMAFHATAKRMLEEARPEARSAAEAYARGVNAAVAALDGRLPPEFAVLRHDFEPVKPDDFVGIMGFMAWGLNMSWHFDPLYEQLVAKVGAERAAELFPYDHGGVPSVHPPSGAVAPAAASAARGARTPRQEPAATRGAEAALARRLFAWEDAEQDLLDALPSLRASNNWVIGPQKSATGRPILANDPHLGHALPGIWYEAHLQTPTQDVTGVTLVGFPLVVIGHNRDVAWGFTNVMLDGADFFVEKLDPARPGMVMHRGEWVPLEVRRETIHVKGEADVSLDVRVTPHGPIVNDLLAEREETPVEDAPAPLAYQWNYAKATQANEVDGLWLLDRARDWDSFRAAVSHFGAVSQNAVYADRTGHIGLQTTGAVPRYTGKPDGTRLRTGWDGSDEWDGFQPFGALPSSFDPPRGWLASANNPTLAAMPYYISSQWEPVDRATRIGELIEATPKLAVEDVERIQGDTLLVSAREIAPLVVAAFEAQPPKEAPLRAAVAELRGWGGEMDPERAAPSLFAVFYRRLFYALFEDELGEELAKGYRARGNVSAIMMRAVAEHGPDRWWDDTRTPAVEDRDLILRRTFAAAVTDLRGTLGGEPATWRWGRLHTLTLTHPLSAVPLLGRYFDRGPFAVPGATSTVNKMEYRERDFRVAHGPSMRQITDFANLDASLAVLPGGESGIPASPHYDDHAALWRRGEYHPFPLSRPAVEAVTAHRLTLVPARAGQ